MSDPNNDTTKVALCVVYAILGLIIIVFRIAGCEETVQLERAKQGQRLHTGISHE